MSFIKSAVNATTKYAVQASLANGQSSKVTYNGGDGDDMIVVYGENNVIKAGNGDDQVAIFGDYNNVFDDDGDNYLYSEGNHNTVNMMNGNQTIQSTGDNNLINAGQGDHFILFTGDENDVTFGDGDTTAYFWGNKNTIVGDNGNHTVKTLDWLIVDEANEDYNQFASLLDEYGIVTDNTTTTTTAINTTSTVKANGTENVSGTAELDLTGEDPVYSEAKAPTNETLLSYLSSSEKALAKRLDLSETLDNGKPRYVFALGSQDQSVHVYDMANADVDGYGVCISSLDTSAGNYQLVTNGVDAMVNADGTGTYITYQDVSMSCSATSGKYSDLVQYKSTYGGDIYLTTTTTGTKTVVTGDIEYDFSAMDNSISLGNGASTVRYTGTGYIEYGDAVNDTENPSVRVRGGLTMDMSNTTEDTTSTYLYSLNFQPAGTQFGVLSDKVVTGSPLIVDFNKDGQVSAKAGMGVDIDNNGTADGAATAGDKMLAMSDMNGNNEIDGSEVFGDQTVNPFTGKKINAANGFEALKEVAKSAEKATGIKCIDNDNVDLQALKKALATVNVNLGFISDNNVTELEDLAHVASINVSDYTSQSQTGAVQHNQLGSYTDTQGNIFKTDDVWFKLN